MQGDRVGGKYLFPPTTLVVALQGGQAFDGRGKRRQGRVWRSTGRACSVFERWQGVVAAVDGLQGAGIGFRGGVGRVGAADRDAGSRNAAQAVSGRPGGKRPRGALARVGGVFSVSEANNGYVGTGF